MSTIYSSFVDCNDAKRAVAALLDHGALKDEIDLVANEKYGVSDNGNSHHETVPAKLEPKRA